MSDDQRGAWERTGKLLENLGHDVAERDPAYGLAQIEFLQMWMRGIYEEASTLPDPSKLESLSRQMAWAGQHLVPERRRETLLAKRPATSQRIMCAVERVRRAR